MAQIDTLKSLLQIDGTSQDALLTNLISQCTAEFVSRTHQSLEKADTQIINEMVIERYNRLGNEGLESINYSGIDEVWYSDYSDRVMKLIKSKARMRTL